MGSWDKIKDNAIYRQTKKTPMAAWKQKLKDPTKQQRKKKAFNEISKRKLMAKRVADLKNRLTKAEIKCNRVFKKTYGRKAFKAQYGIMLSDDHFFIVDFYHLASNLVIEIDGAYHDERKGYDNWRSEKLLKERKMKVIRFTNKQIFDNLSSVLDVITYEISVKAGVDSRANKNG